MCGKRRIVGLQRDANLLREARLMSPNVRSSYQYFADFRSPLRIIYTAYEAYAAYTPITYNYAYLCALNRGWWYRLWQNG